MSAQLIGKPLPLALGPASWRDLLVDACFTINRCGVCVRRPGVPGRLRKRYYRKKARLTGLLVNLGFATSIEVQTHGAELLEFFTFEVYGHRFAWHRPVWREKGGAPRRAIATVPLPWKPSVPQRRRRKNKRPVPPELLERIEAGVALLDWILDEAEAAGAVTAPPACGGA